MIEGASMHLNRLKFGWWSHLLLCLCLLLAPFTARAGEAVFYYHNDATGSPVAITNSTGTVVWKADYEPFGELAELVENVPNHQQFLAKTVDPETSLHLLGARYYDGKMGRFLGVDPALLRGQPASAIQYPQRLSLYSYAGNNPYRHVDPTGRYLETAFDLISFGLSLQSYNSDPSLLNGLALAYDTFAVAAPFLPAGAGMIVHGASGLEKAVDVGGAVNRTDGASNIATAAKLQGQFTGKEIAGGHAFEKHILERGEFSGLEIRTREQFAKHIENVVNNPTAKRELSGGRTAYYDDVTNTVVIRNPKTPDGGTAFQPREGREYFNNLR
ncbi:MAG: exported protein of unknown function [Nitrospira sp.]|nr:MAG: exported protein of unknown function [Nitrospira sp.]